MTHSSMLQPTTWQEKVLSKYYRNRPDWVDGTTQFHQLIRELVKPGSNILEIGAGPTNKTTSFLATLGNVTGLDIDPDVTGNEHCKETAVYDGIHIPRETNSFDVVVSNYVSEHVEHPVELCREIHRVLRPGGFYIFRTPNLWHYVSIIAKLTPCWIHNLTANRLRAIPQGSHNPYPIFHRMNTRRTCRKILTQAGFNIVLIKVIEPEPSYGMASRFLFYPFMIWERLLNSSALFENIRANILCVASARK